MKSTTLTAVSIIILGLVIAGFIFLTKNTQDTGIKNTTEIVNLENVSIVDGKQIIEITARGGYTPRISTAKAGIPTIIRMETQGTYDCSASVRIPSLNILQLLPQSGSTDINIGTPTSGTLRGSCGMGMYPFQVEFK